MWVTTGFSDIKNLNRSFERHESSETHIHSDIALKTFGKSRIDIAVSEQRKQEISLHNARVSENRYILKCLIDTVIFLAKQELAFRGHDESEGSLNRGNYIELLYFQAEKDEKLSNHLKKSKVFIGTSNKIQNDIIESIAAVIQKDIEMEVGAANFIAIELDETTDNSNNAQISMIVRYVNKKGCPVEAFLGFDDITRDKSADGIAKYVHNKLKTIGCVQKLIAQTYDGAAVMASSLNGVQAKVKSFAPMAIFTHCYAHKLNLVLAKSTDNIQQCKIFFKSIEGLSAFFGRSTKRTKILDDVVKHRIPRVSTVRWNSKSRLVQTILVHLCDLIKLFRMIGDNEIDNLDGETISMAKGHLIFLTKSSNFFLLFLFDNIFNRTDHLFNIFQKKINDIKYCVDCMNETLTVLGQERNDFDKFFKAYEEKAASLTYSASISDTSRDQNTTTFRVLYVEIYDNVISQMQFRFGNVEQLSFFGLFDCPKNTAVSKKPDDEILKQLLLQYPSIFDHVRLRADLIGLYSSDAMQHKTQTELLDFIINSDLKETLPEACKLLELILTIPATTASVERSFSALKRIKKFYRSNMLQERLSSLGIISIEKKRLLHLKDNAGFYDAVIGEFVKKDRRMDFVYR